MGAKVKEVMLRVWMGHSGKGWSGKPRKQGGGFYQHYQHDTVLPFTFINPTEPSHHGSGGVFISQVKKWELRDLEKCISV